MKLSHPERDPALVRRDDRITSQDAPLLLHALTEGDGAAQQEALRLLCPCRNRCYDRELWLEVFHAYEEAGGDGVRDAIGHAVTTLLERARTDPRTQELLRWLSEQDATFMHLEAAVPVWRPRPHSAGGLPIPPREQARRSKANRRR
jgi:hypothetical protein